MIQRSLLLSAGMALALLLHAPVAFATLPVDDDEKEAKEKVGGNAADKAAEPPPAAGPAIDRASAPPGYYEEMGDFWAVFLTGGNPFQAALEIADFGSDGYIPELSLQPPPPDAPAESILDAIDERQAQLPMVGVPGSEASAASSTASASGEESAPAPESILDYIDQPAPTPAAQDASKPAADQASRPATVQSKP